MIEWTQRQISEWTEVLEEKEGRKSGRKASWGFQLPRDKADKVVD